MTEQMTAEIQSLKNDVDILFQENAMLLDKCKELLQMCAERKKDLMYFYCNVESHIGDNMFETFEDPTGRMSHKLVKSRQRAFYLRSVGTNVNRNGLAQTICFKCYRNKR